MKSVVTFEPVGRLGNFLFEAASCVAYAWDHGLDFALPSRTRDPVWHPTYLRHLAKPVDQNLKRITVIERQFPHHVREFRPEWKENKLIFLSGYWQNEKYFAAYRDRLLSLFGYPWKHEKGFVSVHVRRGDYLTIKRGNMLKHPPVPKEWYEAQMAKFLGFSFAFYSDDIQWCQRTFGHLPNTKFGGDRPSLGLGHSGRSPEEVDLISMSCCAHHICSASTYSWWGAWMNQNPEKQVIMPKLWITPGWSKLDFSEVVPKEWQRI